MASPRMGLGQRGDRGTVFIDFEGIDGSGKTTLSNLLAARLKRLGYKVAHAREGGELQSPTARRIRELTRDARLLEMGPRAEFFLNLARDAQQLEEVIAPALRRGEVCIADRYLYSQLALTGGGRGVKEEALWPACELASQGLWPDLVILVDVDPDLARLRKRLGKVQSGKSHDADSRKGLVGAGLAVRVREAFLAQARRDPARWLILENNDQPLRVLEQRLVDAVVARLEGREQPVQRLVPAPLRLHREWRRWMTWRPASSMRWTGWRCASRSWRRGCSTASRAFPRTSAGWCTRSGSPGSWREA